MKQNEPKDDMINPEDSELFRQAMQDVTPLHPETHPENPPEEVNNEPLPSKPQIKSKLSGAMATKQHKEVWSLDDIPEQVGADSYLFYCKSPLRPKYQRQLQQGKIKPQDSLDLHDHTLDSAEAALAEFINNAINEYKRYVRIIHGKSHSTQVPPIKNHVNRWLTLHPQVVAFCSCPPHQGGKGAVNVILSIKG